MEVLCAEKRSSENLILLVFCMFISKVKVWRSSSTLNNPRPSFSYTPCLLQRAGCPCSGDSGIQAVQDFGQVWVAWVYSLKEENNNSNEYFLTEVYCLAATLLRTT